MKLTADVFQNHMILQRGLPLTVFGCAVPAGRITVSIQGQSAKATANEDGSWEVSLAPLKASGSEEMRIRCESDHDGAQQLSSASGLSENSCSETSAVSRNGEAISCATIQSEETLTDIAVGEVWIAAGQSNMEFWLRYEKNYREGALAGYDNRMVRFYDVPKCSYPGSITPGTPNTQGVWRFASGSDLEYFSSVGFYFARGLAENEQVPVGIIGCNWGGTWIASWLREDLVRNINPDCFHEIDAIRAAGGEDAYYRRQLRNPMALRTDPFHNVFNEFMLPETHTAKEFVEHLGTGGSHSEEKPEMLPQQIPGSLYENMLRTITPLTVRGVLWYQGESDDVPGCPERYGEMLEAMIHLWRNDFRQDALPFLIVQLPGFERWVREVNHHYDVIRTAQADICGRIPNTWLASMGDAGERFDIHPKNKQIVGRRLLLLALAHVYGEELLADAPKADNIEYLGNILRIHFHNAKGGLVISDPGLNCLFLRKSDGRVLQPFRCSVFSDILTVQFPEDLCEDDTLVLGGEQYYHITLCNRAEIPALPFNIRLTADMLD